MIRFEHLAKIFKGRTALHDLTLEIPQGEIFGLLGHNGAGKSTTFGMLLGQIHPTHGEAFIRGVSVQRDRSKALQGVGAIFESPGFYDYLSGWANLKIFTSYTAQIGRTEIEEAVKFVGLEKRIHDPVRVYSHGMRQRLALAQALLPRPDLVLLDEPAEGLDPEGIHEMRHLILRLNREHGMTVLLSSHQLSEVEQLCSNVAILNQGNLIFHGRWTDLARKNSHLHLQLDDWAKAAPVFEKFHVTVLENSVVELPAGVDVSNVIAGLVHAGVRVSAVEPQRQTLEEIYLGKVSKP